MHSVNKHYRTLSRPQCTRFIFQPDFLLLFNALNRTVLIALKFSPFRRPSTIVKRQYGPGYRTHAPEITSVRVFINQSQGRIQGRGWGRARDPPKKKPKYFFYKLNATSPCTILQVYRHYSRLTFL